MPELLDPGHEVVSGTIGMGKSYLVLYKVAKSFEHNRPCCYIDPKGDTYRNLLDFFAATTQGQQIWEAFGDRIILMNPVSRSDYLVGFNAIEPGGDFPHASPDHVALVANSLVSHIRRQSGFEMAEANRMQNIMSAAIGLLVEGGRGDLTMAEIPLLFVPTYESVGRKPRLQVHNPFVQELLPGVKHHGTMSFWQDQWQTWTANARREWVQSTEGRIFRYLFDERLLMSVCTSDNACLDFRRLVNEGYWLFVNIPYPLLSDTISTILGNIVITKILYACMQRSPGSAPYRLILDEARFFNTGPLDTILETSRAYQLWLTLVVQTLDQMCRSREGHIDYRLKDAAVSLCRYFSAFHTIADGDVYARMMFPITGQVVSGIKTSGDYDFLPVAAEQNEHERRFANLEKRQMVFYDKLSGVPPRVWKTPEVIMDEAEQAVIDRFESQHMRLTGRPLSEIRREIGERQERVRALVFGNRPKPEEQRSLPKMSFGGWKDDEAI